MYVTAFLRRFSALSIAHCVEPPSSGSSPSSRADDRAPRPVTLHGLAECACGLEDRRRPARGIHRAVDPGVQVIAEDDGVVRLLASADHSDDAAKLLDPLLFATSISSVTGPGPMR